MRTNMKNEEFLNARGVSAVVVSLRVASLIAAAKKEFIWYLQGLSLQEGGFTRVARELLEMFPDRLAYTGWCIDSPPNMERLRHFALIGQPVGSFSKKYINQLPIADFLNELCTNPKIQFSLPGIDEVITEVEMSCAIEEKIASSEHDFQKAELNYFRDIVGALCIYRATTEKKIRQAFYITAIGKKVWDSLDFTLASKGMILLNGREGRGKSEAVKAWCQLHAGRARFVNLKGVATKTAMFRAIAAALGVTQAYGRTSSEMQAKIEDVLSRSKIMLVIDEAHYAFNQTRHMTARPELIDWIDTALCNDDAYHKGRVPVALVSTPQFFECLARAKNQVGWNYLQFKRRLKLVQLPEWNTEADIFGVARSVFRQSTEAVIREVVSYALLSARDLSAVGDVATELRYRLNVEEVAHWPMFRPATSRPSPLNCLIVTRRLKLPWNPLKPSRAPRADLCQRRPYRMILKPWPARTRQPPIWTP
jgi:hypothetical protein